MNLSHLCRTWRGTQRKTSCICVHFHLLPIQALLCFFPVITGCNVKAALDSSGAAGNIFQLLLVKAVRCSALAVKAGLRHRLCSVLKLGRAVVHIQLAGDHAVVHLAALVGTLAVVGLKIHIGSDRIHACTGVCFHLPAQRAGQLCSTFNGAHTLAIRGIRQHDGLLLCGKVGHISHENLGEGGIIAEDLGYLTPEVKAMLSASGYPGMKIMQFAFDSRESGNYLPHTYHRNSVVYTGTHDNVTTEGWRTNASAEDVAYACRYLRCKPEDLTEAMICACLASVSDMAIIPLADWLHLGSEARINTPSTQGANWQWRLGSPMPGSLAAHIAQLTALYERTP